MFGKKKKNEYQEASAKLDDKRTAFERLVTRKLTLADTGTDLASEIMAGKPVAINVCDLDASTANKILAFLTGVIYAVGGIQHKIKENVYLFTKKENLDDGSLDKLLNHDV